MYRPPPPPVELKPTLPLILEAERNNITRVDHATSEDVIQQVMTMAEMGNEAEQGKLIEYIGRNLLLTAIDPMTGDSFIHRAAATGNIAGLNTILHNWGRGNWGNNGQRVRELWLLITHQNL